MNKELQRIAIAKACGWTEISERCMWGLPKGAFDTGREDCLKHLPDYCNDLNAMHEAEKTLIFSKRKKYKIELQIVASNKIRNCIISMEELIFATAAQRAEAFLRTLNLWEE